MKFLFLLFLPSILFANCQEDQKLAYNCFGRNRDTFKIYFYKNHNCEKSLVITEEVKKNANSEEILRGFDLTFDRKFYDDRNCMISIHRGPFAQEVKGTMCNNRLNITLKHFKNKSLICTKVAFSDQEGN
jgi:hypothetical protein